MNDCRQGARVRADGLVQKQAKVEIGVEIGLMLDVEADYLNGNYQNLENQVEEKVKDMFHIDNRDKVLTNISIYNIQ